SLSSGRTTCSQEAATVAVRQAQTARAGNQAVFNYHPASGAGPCRTYYSDKQLSVGEIVNFLREPDAGNLPVRIHDRDQETERCQTGWRRAPRKQRLRMPPGDYRYCACSRLHSKSPPGLQTNEIFSNRKAISIDKGLLLSHTF